MAWSTGQDWRVARSLERLREQIRAAFPAAVPPATSPASWGSIADSAHSTTSDHYPHTYAALGPVAVVCARDFPHAPGLGLDAHALADELRRSRDPRIGYLISNGRITGPNYGWQWAPYGGSDPHDTHIHVSTVHTSAADDARDWQIGADMPLTTTDADLVGDRLMARKAAPQMPDSSSVGGTLYEARLAARAAADVGRATRTDVATVRAELAAMRTDLAKLAGRDLVDEPAIVAGVLAGLDPATLAQRIADALPADQAKRVADELARRLVG